MTVGKPDFNLNSFGIQYKEKTVKYTEDLAKVESGQGAVKPDVRQDSKWYKTVPHEQAQTRQNSHHESVNPPSRVDEIGKTPKTDSQQPVGKKPKLDLGATDKLQVQQPMKELEQEIDTQHKIGNKFPSTGKSPQDLKMINNSASETIFKAISLKLDLMNKFGKEAGAKRVTPEEMAQKEAHHTFQGGRDANGQHTVKPKGVGTSVRRVNPKTHLMEKVPNEVKIEGKGNERASTQGDVVNARAASPATVTNAQQMITDNPTTSSGEGTIDPAIASGNSGGVSTWNDGLPATGNSATGGSTSETAATEASAEDTENAANNTAGTAFKNSPIGIAQAARRAKREAAKRKRGEEINLATSEINAMTDGMKELFKGFNGSDAGEEADGKTGFTGKVHEKDGKMVDYVNGVDADGWTVEDNTKGQKTIMPKGGGFKGMQIYSKHRDETKP